MSCDCKCSVVLPNGAASWSAVCDCGILIGGINADVVCKIYLHFDDISAAEVPILSSERQLIH